MKKYCNKEKNKRYIAKDTYSRFSLHWCILRTKMWRDLWGKMMEFKSRNEVKKDDI